ncbi:MAG: flagellar hook capping FlgD N-terminal domain-containing protein [Thermoleophilia bacterium]
MAEATTTTSATGAFNPVSPFTRREVSPDKTFTMDTFLKVLGAQMKAQNPMEPLKDTEFIGQMTQFSSLEQITKLNTTMNNMALSMQITQGPSSVGRSPTRPRTGDSPSPGPWTACRSRAAR